MLTGAIPERSRRSRTFAPGDVCVVLVIGALGVLLALQGWRSMVPVALWVPAIDEAQALLSHGQLPDRGSMTSYTSYAPPGFAWAAVPGMLLFSDPRLFLIPVNVVLHVGTLIGIFLLAGACFGRQCALLSVLLYGLSAIGLLFAGSFEPRGHPFIYVWMTYWACRWVARKDARYLSAALMTWLVGMYGFLEVAPALFILPAVWAFYRPPVRLRSLRGRRRARTSDVVPLSSFRGRRAISWISAPSSCSSPSRSKTPPRCGASRSLNCTNGRTVVRTRVCGLRSGEPSRRLGDERGPSMSRDHARPGQQLRRSRSGSRAQAELDELGFAVPVGAYGLRPAVDEYSPSTAVREP